MNSPRPAGVRVPENQSTEQAPTNTLIHAARCEMIAIEYGDERGMLRQAVVLRSGDKIYMPPNAESWALALKELNPWLANAIRGALAKTSESPAVPKTDDVEVL